MPAQQRSAAKYLPLVILASVLIMALLYFYAILPSQIDAGIHFVNE